MTTLADITGAKFGLLSVIKYLAKDKRSRQYNGAVYQCRCACGTLCEVPAYRLKMGRNVTCGDQVCRKALVIVRGNEG